MTWIVDFFNWLDSLFGVWPLLESLCYWIAAIGGTCSLILYIATKEKKFVRSSVVLFMLYTMIEAALSVL